MKTFGHALLVLGICTLSTVSSCGQSTSGELTPDQKMELKTLTGQLTGAQRSPQTRLEAAKLLLTRPYPQAKKTLRRLLEDKNNDAARIAIAGAIAADDGDGESFIEPLMAMLTGENPDVRAAAAEALASYKDHGVTDKLIATAGHHRKDHSDWTAVRLAAIDALGRSPRKEVVSALIELLNDKNDIIRQKVFSALENITSIGTFGDNADKWKQWWRRNKSRPRHEWLAEVVKNLAESRDALKDRNARLRNRLRKAMSDLYTATASAARDKMLLGMLKDKIRDVRLVGLKIANDRIISNEPLNEDIRSQVRTLCGDDSAEVRKEAALLTASLNQDGATEKLLERLEVEKNAEVRQALLTGLGQLHKSSALGAVLEEVNSSNDGVAAAAASALGRFAEADPLDKDVRKKATAALIERYRGANDSAAHAALREALISALGEVGDGDVHAVLTQALEDKAATVRLAAVNGLANLGASESADAIAVAISDPDRGVRRAAISAVGKLAGKKHLPTIIKRTDASVEPDAEVRKQAWQVSMEILAASEVDVLQSVCKSLKDRDDALEQRIQILQLLILAMKSSGNYPPAEIADAHRRVGEALMTAGRPAEAAEAFTTAYNAFESAETDDNAAQAKEVFLQRIEALLASGNPAVTKVLAEQKSDELFSRGLSNVNAYLEKLLETNKYQSSIKLLNSILEQLPHRLTAEQRNKYEKMLADATRAQDDSERRQIEKLITRLGDNDTSDSREAAERLKTMSERAVPILVEQLKLSVHQGEVKKEKAILDVLARITGNAPAYAISAGVENKLKAIDSWSPGSATTGSAGNEQ